MNKRTWSSFYFQQHQCNGSNLFILYDSKRFVKLFSLFLLYINNFRLSTKRSKIVHFINNVTILRFWWHWTNPINILGSLRGNRWCRLLHTFFGSVCYIYNSNLSQLAHYIISFHILKRILSPTDGPHIHINRIKSYDRMGWWQRWP